MKTETIVSITVILHFPFDDKPEIKRTIHRFNFDDESDKASEIEKFVYDSLRIEEIEAYSRYGAPQRKLKIKVLKNSYNGHREVSYVQIEHVIENEWSND